MESLDPEDFEQKEINFGVSVIRCLEKILIDNTEEYENLCKHGLTDYQKKELYKCLYTGFSVHLKETDSDSIQTKSNFIVECTEGLMFSLLRSQIWPRLTLLCTSEDIANIIFENIFWNLGFEKKRDNQINVNNVNTELEWS